MILTSRCEHLTSRDPPTLVLLCVVTDVRWLNTTLGELERTEESELSRLAPNSLKNGKVLLLWTLFTTVWLGAS